MIRLGFNLIMTTLAISAVALAWSAISLAFCPLGNVSVELGADVFAERCATCHSTQAGASFTVGPSLHKIGRMAATRVPEMSAEAYLLESIIDPGRRLAPGEKQAMPDNVLEGYGRDAILSTVAYLMSQGGEVDYRRIAALASDVQTIPAETRSELDYSAAEAGRKLFLGKGQCSQCHRVKSMPDANLRGPSLVGMGRHSPEVIQKAIDDPNHFVAPAFVTHQIELTSGRLISGRIVRWFDDSITVLTQIDDQLTVKTIDTSQVATDDDGHPLIDPLNVSSMPKTEQLTREEIRCLVEFLRTL